MKEHHRKESPILSLLGLGGGIGGGLAGGVAIPVEASGGAINATAPGNGYKYHVFTSSANFAVTTGGEIEILLVGGGGPSGSTGSSTTVGNCGGGGAGGVVHATAYSIGA